MQLGMAKSTTAAREDYLKAIYHLSAESGDARVSTSALAERLGVRDPSVSAMLKRLAQADLVDYEPRQGVLLTEEGRLATMRVVRRHRLLEAFLVEMLDLDWSEVHAEAEVLEHHLSERMVDAIDHSLGHPIEDPHGHPIPDAEGRMRARSLEPLTALPVGDSATVRAPRRPVAVGLESQLVCAFRRAARISDPGAATHRLPAL